MLRFGFLVLLSLIAVQTDALICLNCRGINHPRFCEIVKECTSGQVCGVEREVKSNGDIAFNLGCLSPPECDSDGATLNGDRPCINCCSSDMCNTKGCGELDLSPKNGTVCYSCAGQLEHESCHSITSCEDFETCYLEEKSHFGEVFYSGGCTVKNVCDTQYIPGQGFGRRDTIETRSSTHFTCCDGNLCNDISHIKSTTTNPPMTSPALHTTSSANIGGASECQDIVDAHVDGVYTILPFPSVREIKVFCIIRGKKKWTVIQRRIDGTQDFFKNWLDYKRGFGSVQGEHWLGNDNIHHISSNGDHELSVYMEDFNGQHAYANYSHFEVGMASAGYILTVSGYSGNAGDGLDNANKRRFSTKDRDNDLSSSNCAVDRHAAWWYNRCDYANLNGLYNDNTGEGPYWYYWHSNTSPLKTAIMMIRRK